MRCPKNSDRKISKGNSGKIAWNHGLTKDTDIRVALAAEKMRAVPGREISPEECTRISEAMKLAHAEGRAWNIGMNRWKKQPSYPEQFFIKAIANNFTDKNYKREVWFKGFVLDFLWEHKKCVIEVDGKQHDTPAQMARDARKDALLIAQGYNVLRIKWRDVTADPAKWISHANNFIGCLTDW